MPFVVSDKIENLKLLINRKLNEQKILIRYEYPENTKHGYQKQKNNTAEITLDKNIDKKKIKSDCKRSVPKDEKVT